MKVHKLKTWPEFFERLLDGSKTFEIRYDDRGFGVGDLLVLEEFDPIAGIYSRRAIARTVSYIMSGPAFGLMAGWCVMGLQKA